jgi:DnaJ-class molecular chaperone
MTTTSATCSQCRGTGTVPDRAVSAVMPTVTGVRATVRRPCPGCHGPAEVSPAAGGRSSSPAT